MFEPPALTVQKKGKKTFAISISILWVIILVVAIWGLSIQSSSSKAINNSDNVLPVLESNQGSQLPSDNLRADEILGSKRFESDPGSNVDAANPIEGAGSVDKLLEGTEIVVPGEENR